VLLLTIHASWFRPCMNWLIGVPSRDPTAPGHRPYHPLYPAPYTRELSRQDPSGHSQHWHTLDIGKAIISKSRASLGRDELNPTKLNVYFL
jgi:hypothetical protein